MRAFRRSVGLLGCAALILALATPVHADEVAGSVPASFSIVGSGFGHGVGMSQWGSYAMAQEGMDAASILTHYFTGTTVTPVPDDMNIRVNLLYVVPSIKLRTQPIDADGGTIELTIGSNVVTGTKADTFTFDVRGGLVGVTRTAGGTTTDLGTADKIGVRWAGTRTPGTAAGGATLLNMTGPKLSLDSPGHRYRYGSVEITPIVTSEGTGLNAINAVRLHDEYLYGISEVSSSWPAASLQAQVIAARSYALAKVNAGIRKACNCHLDDGMGPFSDQTFTGWSKASAAKGNRWLDAVNGTLASETTGQALLGADGKPVKAFYTASTGGMTTSSKDQWGGDLPYAQTVDDHWSLTDANPDKSWTVTLTQVRAQQIFGMAAVQSVAVTERLASGAAKTITATAPDGTTVSKGALSFQGAMRLKSRYLTEIDGSAGVTAPAAQAPMTITMAIGPTVTPKEGSSLEFTGAVSTGKKGVKLQRQLLVDGQWVVKAKGKTKKGGTYSFRVKKSVPAGAVYQYRVVALKNGAVIATSDTVVVTVQP